MYNYCLVILFSATIFSVWSPWRFHRIALWKLLALFVAAFSLFTHFIEPIALLWLAIPSIVFSYLNVEQIAYRRIVLHVLLFFYLLAMGLNLFPGFHRFVLVTPQTIGASAVPFELTYTLAKPFAGLLVLGFMAQRTHSLDETKQLLLSMKGLLNWFVPAIVLLAIGFAIGLKIDVKWLPWFPLFMLTNLTFTVIQEEAFFRGFIQQPLQNRFGLRIWILLATAVPFALVHTPPRGVNLLAFYSVLLVAGILYAWSYFKASKIESVVATHWVVNILHLTLLTYPLAF